MVLVPEHVSEIMKKNSNIKFIVQPCDKRNFSDSEYQESGAEISEDLGRCDLILGVKEVPIEKLYPNKTYMFFSHTIKAQEANMPTLDHILANNIRLIDYEKITNEKGTRLVAFGRFAGIAGAIDFLSGLGHFLVQMGIVTPLLYVAPSYKYFSLKEAFELIKRIGYVIRDEEVPEKLQPLIFAITGKGRCSQGAFEVLKNLPHKIIHPEEMEDLVKNKTNPQHKKLIYITFLESQHMVRNKLGKNFDKQEYYTHPDRFEPIFHEKYLPYISAIFHNMYWDQRFPRLITSQQLKDLVAQKKSRLLGIGDVTCDMEGSIEFLRHFTTPDAPFWVYDPITEEVHNDIIYPREGAILYDSLDFLPCELAFDSSMHFSSQLKDWIENIATSDMSLPLEYQGLLDHIKRAVIACNG